MFFRVLNPEISPTHSPDQQYCCLFLLHAWLKAKTANDAKRCEQFKTCANNVRYVWNLVDGELSQFTSSWANREVEEKERERAMREPP